MADRRTSNLDLFPSIMVNDRTFIGSWESRNVLEMVCAGFQNDVPEVCYKEGVFDVKPISQYLSFGSILFIIVAIIIINIVLYILCRKYVVKKINERVESTELNNQINNVVSRYMAMKETKL